MAMAGAALPIDYCGDIHALNAINPNADDSAPRAVAIFLYGSWNVRVSPTGTADRHWVSLVSNALDEGSAATSGVKIMAASVKVDADDDSLDLCIGGESDGGLGAPSDLPALLFLGLPSKTTDDKSNTREGLRVEHVQLNGATLESYLTQPVASVTSSAALINFVSAVSDAWSRLFDSQGKLLPPPQAKVHKSIRTNKHDIANGPAIRLFIAGDRSQVGKSSICMGLLGALLKSGKYSPTDLAYIKPATQCEQTQLVEEFCKHKGITSCVPVGPIVYYKGFTRAFLKGEVGETSEQLLQKASDAVDKLAQNKKVVIIDGVGYPAVGSITGTDNASVAKACGRSFSVSKSTAALRSPAPVLLIGKSGVGDAVDSFNINATYFTHKNVPVIGAIFNKLSLEGFYSLSNCKEAVEMYFEQYQPDRTSFGFIPEIPSLKNAREHVAKLSKEDQLKQALETADLFVEEFSKYVNVDRVMSAAKQATAKYITEEASHSLVTTSGSKRPVGEVENATDIPSKSKHLRPATSPEYKNSSNNGFSLTREQIEAMASARGAAGG